jgi:AcrR family transcriptional regulator
MARTKQDVVNEFRSSEIVMAARKVFAKKGYRDTTVDEIADTAGLAKGTVYQYFESKEEIFLAALRWGANEMTERTRTRVEEAQGIRAKVAALVRTRLEFLEEHRDFFAVYHSCFGNITHPASINAEFRSLYKRHVEFLEDVLRKAVAAGEIPELGIEVAATTLLEATRGVMLRRILGWSTTTVEQDIESLIAILGKGIGAA